MPIKEIVGIAAIVVTGWFIAEGQQGMLKNVRKAQIQILRDVGRTDNWGNPNFLWRKVRAKGR